MAQVTVEMPLEGIKALLVQLTPHELQEVLAGMQDRLETLQMMQLAESSFAEWGAEEDLYSANG